MGLGKAHPCCFTVWECEKASRCWGVQRTWLPGSTFGKHREFPLVIAHQAAWFHKLHTEWSDEPSHGGRKLDQGLLKFLLYTNNSSTSHPFFFFLLPGFRVQSRLALFCSCEIPISCPRSAPFRQFGPKTIPLRNDDQSDYINILDYFNRFLRATDWEAKRLESRPRPSSRKSQLKIKAYGYRHKVDRSPSK